MNPPRLPQLGNVVWAELEDANGFRKVRPAVIVTASADIAAGKPVRVVAITTRLPTPLPDDHILLPWDRQGKARSGLRRRCAAVASWQAEIQIADVQQVVGILPAAVIGELVATAASVSPSAGSGQAASSSTSPPAMSPLAEELGGKDSASSSA